MRVVESVNVTDYGTHNAVNYSLTVSYAQALTDLMRRFGPARENEAASIPNTPLQRNSTTLAIVNNIDDPLERTNIQLLSYETRMYTTWVIVGNGNQIFHDNSTIFNCAYSYREIVTRDITMYLLTITFQQALTELINQFGPSDSEVAPPNDHNGPYIHNQMAASNPMSWQHPTLLFLNVDRRQNRVSLAQGGAVVDGIQYGSTAVWTNVAF